MGATGFLFCLSLARKTMSLDWLLSRNHKKHFFHNNLSSNSSDNNHIQYLGGTHKSLCTVKYIFFNWAVCIDAEEGKFENKTFSQFQCNPIKREGKNIINDMHKCNSLAPIFVCQEQDRWSCCPCVVLPSLDYKYIFFWMPINIFFRFLCYEIGFCRRSCCCVMTCTTFICKIFLSRYVNVPMI